MILLGVVGILVTILAASRSGEKEAPSVAQTLSTPNTVDVPKYAAQVDVPKVSANVPRQYADSSSGGGLSPDLQKALAKAGGPVEPTQTKYAGDGYQPKPPAETLVPPTTGGASPRGGNVSPTMILVPAFQNKKGLL